MKNSISTKGSYNVLHNTPFFLMSGFRRIEPTIKEMILKQAKEDHRPISEISKEFGVHVKTIYAWLVSEISGTGKTDSQYLNEIH